jgi:hypothetical protein
MNKYTLKQDIFFENFNIILRGSIITENVGVELNPARVYFKRGTIVEAGHVKILKGKRLVVMGLGEPMNASRHRMNKPNKASWIPGIVNSVVYNHSNGRYDVSYNFSEILTANFENIAKIEKM